MVDLRSWILDSDTFKIFLMDVSHSGFMATHSFKNLIVWQKGMDLAVKIYMLTSSFPKSEKYGLSDQMRRSAVSIPSNIAEGQKRSSRAEAAHFSSIALGSAAELETQLLLAKNIYCKEVDSEIALCIEISKMLTALNKNLRAQA